MLKFIDPASIVAQAGLQNGQTVADLGCGSGFYVLPAAQRVGNNGTVYAVDVQEAKLAATQSLARQHGLKNITVVKADLDKPLLDIAEGSCDSVILASILHEIDSRQTLIKNAYRILKTGGKIIAVEWKKQATPLGPEMDRRISEPEMEQLLTQVGLRKEKELQTDGYHYAIMFTK
jgi:ubiquinone/menaquinone biosynthesis C-methylase UbiE